jgi:hypothetical protein
VQGVGRSLDRLQEAAARRSRSHADRAIGAHHAPAGRASLPPEMVDLSHRFDEALGEAVQKGDAGEDDSQGHSLSTNPRMRSLQEQCIIYARSHSSTLRRVHAGSRD